MISDVSNKAGFGCDIFIVSFRERLHSLTPEVMQKLSCTYVFG